MSDNIQTGLVAFFDILGYSAFLENNEPKDAAVSINKFIGKIDKFKNKRFKSLLINNKSSKYLPILKTINHLVISDSILISMACNIEENTYKQKLVIFLLYCSLLMKEMFIFGLPLRGSIQYGDFYITKNTFAGKPIIAAYKEGTNIEISGCIISNTVAIEKLDDIFANDLYFRYLVPVKQGEKEAILINFLQGDSDEDNKSMEHINDPKQFVVNSFAAHNKFISSTVYSKINNTEMFIRFCKSKLNPGFK